ncbi:hypothetical protein DSO57_1008473 [Entomophthora muscae]|uniref:Uncharacterized protein n=1 Tax=Entomophthora muscae TaxID=34485 RepID=A0ACC2SVW3_9FUNG|nr:hypothetical protein DSO57_1008473 [Entomophthora muscae]
MNPIVGLLRYIPYNFVLSQIITGRWGPAVGTLLLPPLNVNSMSVNLGVVPSTFETETLVLYQCSEFHAKDTDSLAGHLSQALLVRLQGWLIINSMWIWVVIPHHLETASYYLSIYVTGLASRREEIQLALTVDQHCISIMEDLKKDIKS